MLMLQASNEGLGIKSNFENIYIIKYKKSDYLSFLRNIVLKKTGKDNKNL